MSACRSAPHQECTKQIKEQIKPGLSKELAESELQKCGFKTVWDPTKKTLYGDKTVDGIPVSERTQVLVNLDSSNRVVDVMVSSGLIGP
jgi:hypothetical protein